MKNTTEESYTVKVVKDVESGKVLSRAWFNAAGQEHNTSGPAVVEYGPDGEPVRQCWMQNGKFHREEADGPAIITRNPDDDTLLVKFYQNNRLHRVDGPAVVHKTETTGQLISERFFRNGHLYQPWLELQTP